MTRGLLRHLGVFVFYLVLAVAFTWPLAQDLGNLVPDYGDPLFVTWVLDWVGHAAFRDPLNLFDAPIYHPAPNTLAFSENMIGIALLMLPFQAAGVPPVAVLNLALLLGFAFSGYGAYILARLITGSGVAALIGGIIHAFGSFKIGHVEHLQIIWSGWLPLILAAILVYWRRPSRWSATLLAGAFLMNGLSNVYYLLFASVALLCTIAFLQFAQPVRDRRFWLRLATALGLAALLLLPVLLPYQTAANTYRARRTSFEARLGSATPMHWLVPSPRSVAWGGFGQRWRAAERDLFPGVLAMILLAAGLWSVRRSPAGETIPARSSPARRSRLWLAAVAFFAGLTLLAVVQDRIAIGPFSFAGADVPAMITVLLLLLRFAPSLRERVVRPELWASGLWLVLGFLASLGWNFFLHPFLFRVITPFRATRVPARWAAIAYVGIAVFVAIGVAYLIAKSHPRWRAAVAALLTALAFADVAARVRWTEVPPVAPVYLWLARENPAAVLEFPMIAEGVPFLYLLAQTEHRVPLVNGTSGWETPAHEQLRSYEGARAYGPAFLTAIAASGAEVLIVHEARIPEDQRRTMAPMLSRLRLVQRFGEDAVYALPGR